MIFKRLDGIAESPEIDPTHMIFKKGAKQYREGGGRGGSGWGTCVHPWRMHVDVWQNQYNIVK